MKLQESIMSDLDAMAREHSELELFIKDALSDKYFNLKNDQDTIDFLKVIFDGAHKQHDMSPMQVTEVLPKDADAGKYIKDFEKSKAPQFKGKSKKKREEMAVAAFMAANKGKMKKEDILKAMKEVLTEKKATYCGRCGHTHVKGTPCPRPFKEGLSTYGDDAYFVAPNKGKMKKEDILKAVKEVLEEGQTFVISSDPKSKEDAKKAAQLAGAKDPEFYKQIDTMKAGDTVTAEETMVPSEDRVSYLEIALGRVWNMGRGNNKIDLNSMAQELVNDMFAKSLDEDLDLGHEDHEPHMVKSELYQIAKYAIQLYKMVDQFDSEAEVDFPAWWQSKITKANSMVSSAKHYLEFELAKPAMDQALAEEKKAKELDPVGHEDEDIDNDGKVDKTDKYLKGRRVKIGAAIAQHSKKK
jgi:rubrerythrin